jgi:hypothetical protein
MTSVIILSFLAGGLVVTGLPHFIKGIMGKAYPMPFGFAGSAMKSVVWGWLCGVVAVTLWHLAPMRFHPRAASFGASIGALVVGLLMSNMLAKAPKHRHADEA